MRKSNYLSNIKIPAKRVTTSALKRHGFLSNGNKSLIAIAQYCKTEGLDVQLGKELCSDSLARAGHQADTYLGMLEYNCETIKQGLMH